MLFNTAQFFLFLGVVLALFYLGPRVLRKPLLLVASYFFYMSWNPKFVLLLLTLTAIDYTAGLWIERTVAPYARKTALVASLSANLGFLAFFKYFNFLAANLAAVLGLPEGRFALDIVLPLGISFHTFQSMSYVVDVYRREQKAVRSPLDYALFIAFFPQLVAGPIVRAREFFKDLYHWAAPSTEDQLRGALLVLLGLAKKMALADQFALLSDSYFQNVAAQPGAITAWTGVFAFAMQIYFDFSGYTDMAIGMAKLLGFHFPTNFARPYIAASITDFWRRWHMSLSRWLRDYLYIALGGNRHGRWMTYRNLMLTMLLGGLWHGASWNFVIWGGYHGALLSVEKAAGLEKPPSRWSYPLRALLTFALVLIGWVFFRAATFGDALFVLRQMFSVSLGPTIVHTWHFAAVALCLLLAWLEEKSEWFERVVHAPAWVYAAVCAALLYAVDLIGVTEKAVPFVYFQF